MSAPVAGKRAKPSAAVPDRPGLSVRLLAAKLLAAVVDAGTSLDGLVDPQGGHPCYRALSPRDQALARAILLSALRWRGTIERALAERLERPLPKQALGLTHLLHVAAAQILFLDVPDPAAVDLAVAAADGDPRSRRFKGLANALLRRLSREKANVVAEPLENMPAWLRARLVDAYGEAETRAVAAAHLVPPALDLTVKNDADAWAVRLGGLRLFGGTVRLGSFDGSLVDLPGFADGAWWVQDAAAALPVPLLGDVAGRRVADLCAAPGGKTAQLAARGAVVTALDANRNRMRRLEDNLARLDLAAETVVADLAAFEPGAPFDAVLLDAPCSSTGTIRRHPDVAWTKNAAEIIKLAAVQARLLDGAARLVRPGGTLVFSNCSILPQEGEDVAGAFLAEHRDFRLDPIRAGEVPGLAEAVSSQGFLRTTPAMLPGPEPRMAGLDGFFAARFVRIR